MKLKSLVPFLIAAQFLTLTGAKAGEKNSAGPASWGYVARRTDVRARQGNSAKRNPVALTLGRGALVNILEVKSHGSTSETQVRAVNPSTLEGIIGWVDSSEIESEPLDRYPPDIDLLNQMGGAYMEDLTASSARIVRYVFHNEKQGPTLVCFIGSRTLPQTRLQVFQSSHGKFAPGPYLEFPSSEMQSGIISLEIRDLLGDGNECIVTHEPFRIQPENEGVNLVIRRIEGPSLKTLWKAPIQYQNLASFSTQHKVLEPPEKNIGANGTVTTATVEFRAHGALTEPVWKGRVEFYMQERKEPLDVVNIEKLCPWDGSEFAPIP